MITIGLMTNDLASGNLGVVALGISNILLIEKACNKNGIEHSYILFGRRKQADRQLDIIRRFPELNNISLSIDNTIYFKSLIRSGIKFKSAIQKCDVVFDTSGGDSFSDIYGSNRIIHQLLPKEIVIRAGVPLVFTPQTIGPFKSSIWKLLAIKVMNRSQLIFARDNLSYGFLRENLNNDTIYEATDMAMALPYQQPSMNTNQNRCKVGINVSGLLYHGGYTGKNQFNTIGDYASLIQDIILFFINKQCEVHLIPHVIGSGIESDNEVCKKLINKYRGIYYSGEFRNPVDAKNYIAQMDFFVGSRMHSTIAAISAGVPVIPLSYSRKFEGLFSTIGYDYCVNLSKNDNAHVLKYLEYYYNHIKELQKAVNSAKIQIEKRVAIYSSIIEEYLKGIDEKKT